MNTFVETNLSFLDKVGYGLKFKNLSYKSISIESTIAEHGNRNTKKSSIRTIGIDNKLYRSLIQLKKYYMKTYNNFNEEFFIFGDVKPLAPTTINRIKKAAAAKAKGIRIHDFRHSHATLLDSKNN